jgi:Xaa-Pro aminopeptidase
MVKANIHALINALREQLQQRQLQGILIPSMDEHLNEYLPEARQRRQALTGFTGSTGDALVTLTQAWLAVDSRYYEQAEQQVSPEIFTVLKQGLPQQPTLYEVIAGLGAGFRLGVDPFTVSGTAYQDLHLHADIGQVKLVPILEPWIDRLWQGGEIPYASQPVYPVSLALAGMSVADKLQQVRRMMEQKGIGVLPVTKLDHIAWVLNLRGSDIPYNPVFIAYLLIGLERVALFTNRARLTVEAREALQEANVEVLPYEAYSEQLQKWVDQYGLPGIDPRHLTQGSISLLSQLRQIVDPIEQLKAKKNPVELEQMRRANQAASRAKIRTLAWVDQQWQQGITEADVSAYIVRCYQEDPDWVGLSFATIAATGSNSSIVHYSTPSEHCYLNPGQFLLLDSGSQYWGGTTDDTRTVILGDPTPLQCYRYTQVLKAHIQCASQPFPVHTFGSQLDGITRSSLWQAGMDYGHGTGHGVGAFLNVHEGPNGISKKVQAGLEAGMITSIEPGFYEVGWGGIRLENLYEIVPIPDKEGWLTFQPLTWIPFDNRLIDPACLSSFDHAWLTSYHHQVYEKFAETLDPEDRLWLAKACRVQE